MGFGNGESRGLIARLYGLAHLGRVSGTGTVLLGVKAVFSKVFERIHRANLVGMGVLPMNFVEGDRAAPE
jgi:aconitate hydratase